MVVEVGLMPAPSYTSILEQHNFFVFVGVAIVDPQHAPANFSMPIVGPCWTEAFSFQNDQKYFNSALVPRRDLPADTRRSTNVSWPFLDAHFSKICRSIVGSPSEIDWNANRHDMFISSAVEVHNCIFAIDPDPDPDF